MATVLFLISCNEATGPIAQQRSPSTLWDYDTPTAEVGEAFYKALYQGRGPLAEVIPFVRDNYQASLLITDAEEDSLYNAGSDQIIDAINNVDPTFFADFAAHLTSGNHFVVTDGLAKAYSITLEAQLTIPQFMDNLEALAEDDTLLENIVGEINEQDPNSEATVEELRSYLEDVQISGPGAECVVEIIGIAVAVVFYVYLFVYFYFFFDTFAWFSKFWVKWKGPTDFEGTNPGLTSEMLVNYIVENHTNPDLFDPSHSDIPQVLLLGGRSGNTIDPNCEYHAVIRNAYDEPLQGVTVTLEWGSGFPNRNYCTDPAFPNMSYNYSPATGLRTMSAVTDANGNARFRLMGSYAAYIGCGGSNTNDSFANQYGTITIEGYPSELAEGYPAEFFMFKVATPDLNGTGGITSADMTLFINDRDCSGGSYYAARSDFDGDGDVDTDDGAILTAIINGGDSPTSTCNELE